MAAIGAGAAATVVLAPVAARIHRHSAAPARLHAPRNDVDHATHGRTAVLRRTGTFDHFHTLDLCQQVLAQIHRGAGTGRNWQTVDQHQHLVSAQTLQRQFKARLAMHLAQLQTGHVLQRLLQGARMGEIQFFARNHLNGHGGLVDGAFAARCRHHHGRKALRVLGLHSADRRHDHQQPQRRAKKREIQHRK